jgi:hypothetical protein
MNEDPRAVWWLFFQIVLGGTNSKEITKSGKGRASFRFVRIWKGVRIRFLDLLLLRNGKEVYWLNYRKLAAELFIWYYYNHTDRTSKLQHLFEEDLQSCDYWVFRKILRYATIDGINSVAAKKNSGDSRHTRGFSFCESPRIPKTHKTGNVYHHRGFSEWYIMEGS